MPEIRSALLKALVPRRKPERLIEAALNERDSGTVIEDVIVVVLVGIEVPKRAQTKSVNCADVHVAERRIAILFRDYFHVAPDPELHLFRRLLSERKGDYAIAR